LPGVSRYRLPCSAIVFHPVSCIFFFFFSSRRRHTRSKRDWSSDVCSSDLAQSLQESARRAAVHRRGVFPDRRRRRRIRPGGRRGDRKSTRLNSSHVSKSYAVFCLKKKKQVITGTLVQISID